mmetsp:Transcript_37903/g.121607  ORF Transcript_37903/g.121607 Transcript_37903/m.121607 type:complete len:213 (-) Transcript_37903:304-942(-)
MHARSHPLLPLSLEIPRQSIAHSSILGPYSRSMILFPPPRKEGSRYSCCCSEASVFRRFFFVPLEDVVVEEGGDELELVGPCGMGHALEEVELGVGVEGQELLVCGLAGGVVDDGVDVAVTEEEGHLSRRGVVGVGRGQVRREAHEGRDLVEGEALAEGGAQGDRPALGEAPEDDRLFVGDQLGDAGDTRGDARGIHGRTFLQCDDVVPCRH